MARRRSKHEPQKPAKKKTRRDALSDSVHGVPPGVSFGTREGRQAQGMDEQIGNKPQEPPQKPEEKKP